MTPKDVTKNINDYDLSTEFSNNGVIMTYKVPSVLIKIADKAKNPFTYKHQYCVEALQ